MKVTKADIAAAEAIIASAKARRRVAVEAREAAQAVENNANADVFAAEEVLNELLAAQVLERLPADLASALAGGITTLANEQWVALARRGLAKRSPDRWSREPYWLTAMGRKVRRLIQERERGWTTQGRS